MIKKIQNMTATIPPTFSAMNLAHYTFNMFSLKFFFSEPLSQCIWLWYLGWQSSATFMSHRTEIFLFLFTFFSKYNLSTFPLWYEEAKNRLTDSKFTYIGHITSNFEKNTKPLLKMAFINLHFLCLQFFCNNIIFKTYILLP